MDSHCERSSPYHPEMWKEKKRRQHYLSLQRYLHNRRICFLAPSLQLYHATKDTQSIKGDMTSELVGADVSNKQVAQINPELRSSEKEPPSSSTVLGDVSSFLSACDQVAAQDDFVSFKTEVQEQLGNITDLMQTIFSTGGAIEVAVLGI